MSQLKSTLFSMNFPPSVIMVDNLLRDNLASVTLPLSHTLPIKDFSVPTFDSEQQCMVIILQRMCVYISLSSDLEKVQYESQYCTAFWVATITLSEIFIASVALAASCSLFSFSAENTTLPSTFFTAFINLLTTFSASSSVTRV